MALFFNLTAGPSAGFLSRHIGIDPETAWRMLGQIRQHISRICERGSRILYGKSVYVENLQLRNVLSGNGRKTGPSHVVVVAVAGEAFAFALPRKHPCHYRELFARLGVSESIFTYDFNFYSMGQYLEGYRVSQLAREESANSKEEWACFQSGRALAVYLTRSLRKWPVKVKRSRLQTYLDEFVFRFNFAQDKAIMFPLFLCNFDPVSYCDEAEARSKVERFRGAVSRSLS